MKTVIVLDNQRLIDISMQELGDVERLVELAALNGVSMTEELVAGSTIQIPDYEAAKVTTVKTFSDTSKAPASATESDHFPKVPPGGIGYMQIGGNFIVS